MKIKVTQSDPKEMSLLFDLWLLMHSVAGLLDDALEGEDLSGDDFGLYSLLRVFGPSSPTEISQWTGMRATTVSAALKRIALRGHSKQQANPADGRSYQVALNAAGIRTHAATARPFLNLMGEVSDVLASEEWSQRVSLQRLDSVVRQIANLGERPYTLTARTNASRATLTYGGNPLTPKQDQQVLQYINFLRSNKNVG